MAETGRNDARIPEHDYWARQPDHELLGANIMERVNRYLDSLQRTARLDLWRRANQLFYGMDATDGDMSADQVRFGGEQGEVALVRENHFRNLIRHVLTLITGTRPNLNAKPVNTDALSLEAAKVAQGIFEYYLDHSPLEREAMRTALYASLVGEGWISFTWNPSASADMPPVGVEDVIDPETGEVALDEDGDPLTRDVFAGDFEVFALHPVDVIRDTGHDVSRSPHNWVITHKRVNRWDLMAEFPDMKEEIANVASIPEVTADVFTREEFESLDEISMYELWHDRRPSMPDGRYAAVVGEHVLLDGPLPYAKLPVFCMMPDPETRTAHGYADAFDMMGLQEIVDSCISTAVTNNDAGGTINFWTPTGSDLTLKELAEGLTWWESIERPESIVLAEVSDVTWKLREAAIESMQKISGVNDVARGEPDPGMSGAMAALIHAMAIQSNSSLQWAYGRLLEQLGNHKFDCIQRHMEHERVVSIAGHMAKEMRLSKSSMPAVRRISVELGSALQRTMSGRQELTYKFLEMGAIKTPDQMLQCIATGSFDPLTVGPEALYRGIQSENEHLINGQGVVVLQSDNHVEHVKGHLEVLREPSMRTPETEGIREVLLEHVTQHITHWRDLSNDQANGWPLLLATGQQPLSFGGEQGEQGAPGGAPQPPGGDAQPGLNAGAAKGAPTMAGAPPELGESPARMPSLPTNPNDGQQYDPAGQAGPM